MPMPRGEPEGPAARAGGGLWDGLWQRLVRRPAGEDGADRDARGAYSREALQAMIERKRHNDALRHHEFDTLRKLRQRDAAGGAPAAHPVLFQSSVPSGAGERATTLRKIDEIEAQMSIQWRRVKPRVVARPAVSLLLPEAPVPPPAPEPAYDRALADAVSPAVAPDAAVDALVGVAPVSHAAFFVHDPDFDDAALCFARGDAQGAEAALLAMLSPGHPRSSQPAAWHVLFDLYRATGQQAVYDERATEFACRFQCSPPQWRDLFESAPDLSQLPRSAGESAETDWTCPPVLDGEGVRQLNAILSALPQPWRLAWHALGRLEADALPALAQLVTSWACQPVRLQMAGVEALERVLASRTACGDRSADPRWWTLRMDWLRAMRRSDEFELVALDYCVTYEVSPPAWEPPLCDIRAASGEDPAWPDTGFDAFVSRVSALGGGDPSSFLASAFAPPVTGELAGTLLGDIDAELARLDQRLQGAERLIVSCARLVRIDFEAAGALLNWVSERQTEGRTVHLVEVHRLVAAFLAAMGLACITVRRD